MGGTHEHLEHAEHAEHAAHNPFDKRVAMTMTIVATALASVTLLSHREHNDTILKQAQATTLHTQASDQWNFFQAKNIRMHEYNALDALLGSLAKESTNEEPTKKTRDGWQQQAKKYQGTDLPKLKAEAEGLVKQAMAHEQLSHEAHQRSNYFDGGHLFIELALILCSIAILTKMRSFWFGGMIVCAVGIVVAVIPFTPLWAMFASHGAHDTQGSHAPASSPAPETPGKTGAEKPAH